MRFEKGYKPWWDKKPRVKMICKICGKPFEVKYSRKNRAKYCSQKCQHISLKGKPSWNKGISYCAGDKHPLWQGDKAGRFAVHRWIDRHKGKPEKCLHCETTSKEKRLNWANKDHKYHRSLDDFIPLCVSCHHKYDIKHNGYKLFGR